MLPQILTIAMIATLIEMIHLGKELWEKFHTCSSFFDILQKFVDSSSMEQAGTLLCIAILLGTIAAAAAGLAAVFYRVLRAAYSWAMARSLHARKRQDQPRQENFVTPPTDRIASAESDKHVT